jgi:ribosome-associated toxin RatA of RatAB toxin-antitoxin module
MRPGSIFLLTMLLSPAAAAEGRWSRALDRGEILVYSRTPAGGSAPEVVVKAVIDAPPQKVWDLVSRCGSYERTMPRIKAARELSRRDNRVVCRVTVDMPFPYSDLTATTRVIHEVHPRGRGFSRRWELVSGDYRVNRGSWVLRPFKGDPRRTYVVYRAQAVPKAWIPGWIRRTAQKRSLPEMIRRLRRLSRGRA